jgi:hypothetical protein
MIKFLRSLFPVPPKQFPKHATELGWAPRPDNPNYPFHMPPRYHDYAAKALGGIFVFWILLRFKEDGKHEILVSG